MFTKGPLYGSCIMALTKHTKLTQVFIHKLITVTAVSKHMKLMLLVGACGVQNGVCWFNTLWPEQNGCHFADDIFKLIFLHENCCIFIQVSLIFFPKSPNKNKPALDRIMPWHQISDKSLPGSIMPNASVSPTTHGVTKPQRVNHH